MQSKKKNVLSNFLTYEFLFNEQFHFMTYSEFCDENSKSEFVIVNDSSEIITIKIPNNFSLQEFCQLSFYCAKLWNFFLSVLYGNFWENDFRFFVRFRSRFLWKNLITSNNVIITEYFVGSMLVAERGFV